MKGIFKSEINDKYSLELETKSDECVTIKLMSGTNIAHLSELSANVTISQLIEISNYMKAELPKCDDTISDTFNFVNKIVNTVLYQFDWKYECINNTAGKLVLTGRNNDYVSYDLSYSPGEFMLYRDTIMDITEKFAKQNVLSNTRFHVETNIHAIRKLIAYMYVAEHAKLILIKEITNKISTSSISSYDLTQIRNFVADIITDGK